MNPRERTPSAQEAGQAMRDAAIGMSVAFAGLAAALERFGRSLYAVVWHSYIMAGAPYGETRKGLMKWMREQQGLNT